jgi:hypothetical protein
MRHVYCIILIILFCLWSCSKKAPDTPPDNSTYDPHLKVTHTIAQLRHMPPGAPIREDIVICGIVIMDDKSGNYNRKIVIQDSTGGIEVLIDQDNLYNDYPVGRRLYLKCKGLCPGSTALNPQLGYLTDVTGTLSPIPALLADQYIIKGNYPNVLVPDTVTLAMLVFPDKAEQYLNTLVAIREVQFDDLDTMQPYAQQAVVAAATNRLVRDCNNGSIAMRNSGYAGFQPYLTPSGKGLLTAVYTRFNGTPQIYIRDTGDVRFYDARCGVPAASEISTVAVIRSLVPAAGDSVDILPVYKIAGVVISDRLGGNTSSYGITLQDGDKGIFIRFSGSPFYYLGDSLVLNITGGKLARFNGQLQVSNIPVTAVHLITAGRTVAVRTATITEILLHYKDWESTLIKVPQVSIPAGGNYSGYKTLNDGTGTLTMYTLAGAIFASAFVPQVPRSFTGILGTFEQTPQLQMRNINDVVP